MLSSKKGKTAATDQMVLALLGFRLILRTHFAPLLRKGRQFFGFYWKDLSGLWMAYNRHNNLSLRAKLVLR